MSDLRTVEKYFQSLQFVVQRGDVGPMLKLLDEGFEGTDLNGKGVSTRKELLASYRSLPRDSQISGTDLAVLKEGEVEARVEVVSESLPKLLQGVMRFYIDGDKIIGIAVKPAD